MMMVADSDKPVLGALFYFYKLLGSFFVVVAVRKTNRRPTVHMYVEIICVNKVSVLYEVFFYSLSNYYDVREKRNEEQSKIILMSLQWGCT